MSAAEEGTRRAPAVLLNTKVLKALVRGDSAPRGADPAGEDHPRDLRRPEPVPPRKGEKKARGQRAKKANPARRPWPGPAKQSAFVFLFQGDAVYAVRNRAGELGAPGGKRDPGDRGIWDAARREFREETGVDMPGGAFAYLEWGTVRHSIRVYYRDLAPGEEGALPLGSPGDPDDEEVETLWALWAGEERKKFRPHIAQALKLYEAMAGPSA